MKIARSTIAAAVAVASAAATASGQTWRTIDFQRGVATGGPTLEVQIEHAAGRVSVRGGDAGGIAAHLRYDASVARPHFEITKERVEVGSRARPREPGMRHVNSTNELMVELPRNAPMALDIRAGAVEGEIDLGGLSIDRLRLGAGAGDIELRFSVPNTTQMETLEVDAGAAAVRVSKIGNARVSRVHLNQGVGKADLDFSGEWTGRIDAELDVGIGAVEITVPEDAGVRFEVRKFLTKFDHDGLERRDDGMYYSPNFERAPRTVVIRVNSAIGAIRLKRG